ncbi:MAG: hypothetical protein MSS96_06485, partial [Bacteroidales bacterium]|nr:hypothetical protein [Bacteroidales bacterium]
MYSVLHSGEKFVGTTAIQPSACMAHPTNPVVFILIQVPQVQGTADIFRGFMVSLYVKGKENGHVQAYAPTGAMGLKRWGG